MNRELVFSARDNGVTSFMDKMRRSAVDVGRGILQDSMAQSKNAKEAISHYEKQIALIQQKNRLERDSERAEAVNIRDKGMGSAKNVAREAQVKGEFSSTMNEISRGSKEDQLQVDLLKELISAVKGSSEKELRQDQIDSKRESEELETLIQGEDGGEFRTTASKLRAERKSEEDDGKGGDSRRGGGVVGIVSGAKGVASSSDGTGAMQKTLDAVGKGTILGTIAGVIAIAVAGLNIKSQREQSASETAALRGMTNKGVLASDMGVTDFFNGYGPTSLGVSRENFLSQNIPGAIRAAGTSKNAGSRAMDMLEVEKGLALSAGTGNSLEKLGRILHSDSKGLTNDIFSSMYGTGAMGAKNTDMARMQDIVGGFVGFQEQQFSAHGGTHSEGTLQLMRGLQKMGGRYERDDYMMSTVQGLNQGLGTEGSAEARAIKFDILRKRNPGKSMFELQMEMEKGINSEGYLQDTLNFVKQTGGDLNAQSYLMQGLTGGQMRNVDIDAILRGDLSLEEFTKRDSGAAGKALAASSPATAQMLTLTEEFKDMMGTVGGGVETAIESIREIDETLENLNSAIDNMMDFFN